MSIFNIFGGNGNHRTNEDVKNNNKVNLTKEDTIKKVNLLKEDVQKVCLTKDPLKGLKAQVGLVLDYSGSMRQLYNDGTVQDVIEKILPLGMTFDDNGSVEVWIFHDSYRRLPDITLSNVHGYIKREIIDKGYQMGGTSYAPVMENVVKAYKKSKLPSYVFFLTDGDNDDRRESENVIKEASKLPIFWQFVGLGHGFSFLKRLDDMKGRYVDNADFFAVKNVDDITYNDILNEFPEWLSNDLVKDMLK